MCTYLNDCFFMTPCKNSDFYNAWSHKDQTEVRKINQFYNPFLMSYVCTYLNVPYDATQKNYMSSNNVRGDISRAGIIFLKGL